MQFIIFYPDTALNDLPNVKTGCAARPRQAPFMITKMAVQWNASFTPP